MSFSNLFRKNKEKHDRSRKSGAGSSSAGSESSHDTSELSVTGGSPVIVVWDLNSCGIPAGCRLNRIRKNIAQATGSRIARLYIFCNDSTVRENIMQQANQVVEEFPPDVSQIVSLAQTLTNHVLWITGDHVSFCPIVSILRHRNLEVGVACLESHCNTLKWIGCYAFDWDKIIRGEVPSMLVWPRQHRIITPGDDCNMHPINIYWDLDSCKLQESMENEESMAMLTERFQNVLRSYNYWGRFKVYVYGGEDVYGMEAFYANHMKLQLVPRGSRIDASKMILDDIFAMMHNCDCANCFMIITNGNVRIAEGSVKNRGHDLIVVRPSPSRFQSTSADITLEWPDILY